MGVPRDLLPPAARLAACSAAEAPAPKAAVGGGEAALAELETREGPVRYAAYAGRTAQFIRMAERVRTRLCSACTLKWSRHALPCSHDNVRRFAQVSSIRHLAYASDVGEAFRPTVPKWVVNGTYAVAFGRVPAASAGTREPRRLTRPPRARAATWPPT